MELSTNSLGSTMRTPVTGDEFAITNDLVGATDEKVGFQNTLHNYGKESKKNTLHNYGKRSSLKKYFT